MEGKPNNEETQQLQASPGGSPPEPETGPPEIDYAAEIAQRDARIAESIGRIEELEASLAAAGEASEALGGENEALRGENDALRAQAEVDRENYELALAGCFNAKAGRAVLGDYGGDIEAMKKGEPWMFRQDEPAASGATGLPNAGAASDDGQDREWRELAGLPPTRSGEGA